MCVASFVYHEHILKRRLHQMCTIRCTAFWTKNIPSEPYVRTKFPLEATTDTMDITGVFSHTTLVSEIERLKCIIGCFKVSVPRAMKWVLKDDLNVRDIGGQGFVRKFNFV